MLSVKNIIIVVFILGLALLNVIQYSSSKKGKSEEGSSIPNS